MFAQHLRAENGQQEIKQMPTPNTEDAVINRPNAIVALDFRRVPLRLRPSNLAVNRSVTCRINIMFKYYKFYAVVNNLSGSSRQMAAGGRQLGIAPKRTIARNLPAS